MKNLENVCVLEEDQNGEFTVYSKEPLQFPDKFLLNGIKMRNNFHEINIFGVDYVHQYDEQSGKFLAL
mgnify:FL=1